MKKNTSKKGKKAKNVKSSITLPPAELAMVEELMKRLKAPSKVDVIRQGLRLLQVKTKRELLAAEFKRASEINEADVLEILAETDHLNADGLPDEEVDYSKW